MKFMHLTHIKNLNSILKYGLLPTFIDNSAHWENFQKDLENRKCVYLWDAETYNNAKYLKDMIYTKLYIHPRNKVFGIRYDEIIKENRNNWDDDDRYINFKDFGDKLYGEDSKYVYLEIESSGVDYLGHWLHAQTSGEDKTGTTVNMDDKYAHEDKKLYISPGIIRPDNIKIAGHINTRIYKSNKIGFTFTK